MLDCHVNNLGSDKTLKALGGKLERTEIDPSNNILTNVYTFNVDDIITKYKDTYMKFLFSEYLTGSSIYFTFFHILNYYLYNMVLLHFLKY